MPFNIATAVPVIEADNKAIDVSNDFDISTARPVSEELDGTGGVEVDEKQSFVGAAGDRLLAGLYSAAGGFNKLIGLGAFEKTEELFITSSFAEAERLRNKFTPRNTIESLGLQFAESLGGLAATLPLDVMTGGATKIALSGKVLPAMAALLSRIPDFAIGIGIREFIAGAQVEGGAVKKTGQAVIRGAEGLAMGTIYGSVARLKIPAMASIGVGEAAYSAFKQGRTPTQEEMRDGLVLGAAYGTFFSLIPFLQRKTKIVQEKIILGKAKKEVIDFQNKKNLSGIREVFSNLAKNKKLRPEIRETFGIAEREVSIMQSRINDKPKAAKKALPTPEEIKGQEIIKQAGKFGIKITPKLQEIKEVTGVISKVTPEQIQKRVTGKELTPAEKVKAKQITGRLAKLDTEIKDIRKQIDVLVSQKQKLQRLDQPVETLENKIKQLQRKEEVVDSERGELLTTQKELITFKEEKIEIKAKELEQREIRFVEEKLKAIDKGIREGTIKTKKEIEKTQNQLISFIEKSELNKDERFKFIRTIRKIQNNKQLEERFPGIKKRIRILVDKAAKRTLKEKITKELKAVKLKKRAGKKVGRLTAATQGAIDLIRNISKMTPVEAEVVIAKNIEQVQDFLPSEDIRLQNELLNLISGKEEKSVDSLVEILGTIRDLKKQGLEARKLLRTETQEKLDELKETVIGQVTGGLGIKPGRETTGAIKTRREKLKGALKGLGTRWVLSWSGMMETIEFNAGVDNKKLKALFSVLQQENKTKELELNFRKDFDVAISKSYGLEKPLGKIKSVLEKAGVLEVAIHRKLNDLSQKINLGKFKNTAGIEVELIFTTDEIIKKWMELQDPTLIESFKKGNKFTDEIITVINDRMNDADKAFAGEQFALYKKQWRVINPIYRKFFGVNLPLSAFYSPIAREGFKTDLSKTFSQLTEDFSRRLAVTASSLKARIRNVLPLRTQSSVEVLNRHFKETNYFVAWAEKMKEIESVFKDSTVREAINQEFSPGVLKAIGNIIDDISTRGNRGVRRFPTIDLLRKGFTLGRLMGKASITIKQFVSTAAYLEKINPIELTVGIADFWLTNPLKNFRTLQKESIFIKTRGLANMERDISAGVKSTEFKQYSRVRSAINTMMLNVHLGDKGAIVFGSWALRRVRLKQKVPIADIIQEYEEFSADTQQSADISRLSEVQRGGSLDRLFTWFKSSQRQYLAKELNVIKSLFQKGGLSSSNIKNVAKTLAIYHILLPILFQFIANAGGWDEEDRKDYLRAGILGSFNGLFIFGDIIDSVIRKALGLRVWDLELPIFEIGDIVNKALGKLTWDDITTSDVFEALGALSEALNFLALPASQVKNMILGIDNIINKDIKAGVLEILGWSPFFAE